MKCVGLDKNGCKFNCSDIRCLTIDHINGGGRQERKKLKKVGVTFYHWLQKQGYPEGYQVLCMNCQFIKLKMESE
jgi:hypothetical protein